MRRKGPPRVLGPYPERNRYRLVVIENGARKSLYVGSLDEARVTKDELEKHLMRPPTVRLDDALDEYAHFRVQTARCLERTSEEQMARLRQFLDAYVSQDIAALTPRAAQQLYAKATERTSEKTGTPVAAATHRFYLGLAKSFFNWAVTRNYVKESPFKGVTPIGKVRVGKPQLRIDEARRFAETALTLYTEQGDTLALAALMALLLGLRASEVLLRVARDVDDGGRILWIDGGKTHNARRHLRVPEVLQGHPRLTPASADRAFTLREALRGGLDVTGGECAAHVRDPVGGQARPLRGIDRGCRHRRFAAAIAGVLVDVVQVEVLGHLREDHALAERLGQEVHLNGGGRSNGGKESQRQGQRQSRCHPGEESSQ